VNDGFEIFATRCDRCEQSLAQRDAFEKSLRSLVAHVDSEGGYTTHAQQAMIREARALLAEYARG